jgi:23S rRNA pseudouridine1911/1915/1917 synthase
MGSGDSIIETTIGEAQHGLRLDKALADLLPELSRERLKSLIVEGQVTAQGRALNPSMKVMAGQAFAITLPPPVEAEAVAQDIPLNIVHEDADLIVIDKPAGLVVHPAAGNLDGTLVNALLHHCRGQLSGIGGVARPGIVHRIDKDTSGLLVVAKSDKAHEGLAQQFKAHSIDRLYAAIVYGIPGSADRTPTARRWRYIAKDGASTPSPIIASWTGFAAQRWSNAGWKPGGRIRFACIWRIWATP